MSSFYTIPQKRVKKKSTGSIQRVTRYDRSNPPKGLGSGADPPSGSAGLLLFFVRGFQNLHQFLNPIHGIGHPHHPSLPIFTLSRFAHQEHEQRIALDRRVLRSPIGRMDTTGVMLGHLLFHRVAFHTILLPVDHHWAALPEPMLPFECDAFMNANEPDRKKATRYRLIQWPQNQRPFLCYRRPGAQRA